MVVQFTRIIIQIAAIAVPILVKSFQKAYTQASANAPQYAKMMGDVAKNRVQPMQVNEAFKILGLEPPAKESKEINYEKIYEQFRRLHEKNELSFYIQSKVYRAKECIDAELQKQGFEIPAEFVERYKIDFEADVAKYKSEQNGTSSVKAENPEKKE